MIETDWKERRKEQVPSVRCRIPSLISPTSASNSLMEVLLGSLSRLGSPSLSSFPPLRLVLSHPRRPFQPLPTVLGSSASGREEVIPALPDVFSHHQTDLFWQTDMPRPCTAAGCRLPASCFTALYTALGLHNAHLQMRNDGASRDCR